MEKMNEKKGLARDHWNDQRGDSRESASRYDKNCLTLEYFSNFLKLFCVACFVVRE